MQGNEKVFEVMMDEKNELKRSGQQSDDKRILLCGIQQKQKKNVQKENTGNTKGNRIEFQVTKTGGDEGGFRKR